MDIKDIRNELNAVDEKLLLLLKERYALVEKVVEYKTERKLPIFDPVREQEILDRVDVQIENRIIAPHIVDTYREIMRCSRDYQAGYAGNIVLIGMPGCGKSTIGRKIAEKYGYKFVDADDRFTEVNNMTAAACITEFGEKEFRKRESEVLKSFEPDCHTVFSLGGGVITVDENYDVAKRLGKVVYIKRDLDKLASKGRPLSNTVGVEKLFEERKAKYERWADCEVVNNDLKTAVSDVIAAVTAK